MFYICDHADGCPYEECSHRKPHEWRGVYCHKDFCGDIEEDVKCIPVDQSNELGGLMDYIEELTNLVERLVKVSENNFVITKIHDKRLERLEKTISIILGDE